MKNGLILLIILILFIPALKATWTHLKGEGACCGGPKEKSKKKKIKGKVIDSKIYTVEGMHCVNCKNRIENHLNELEGIVAKVNLEKKTLKVDFYQEADENEIKLIVQRLGYRVK